MWNKYPNVKPTVGRHYQCVVLVPSGHGSYEKKQMVLNWWSIDQQWSCDGIIVTHWRECFEMPED